MVEIALLCLWHSHVHVHAQIWKPHFVFIMLSYIFVYM
jgi:cell shape-determining protein MreD